ncbi:PhnD/SsuA/transferrin family substrate-binding protein [Jhaorihella thermophila]
MRLGITPVFLDNDAEILTALRSALQEAAGQRVQFEQRRTYEEVTGMLLEGAIEAAWLCGYPFLQHRATLALMAVPLWHGKPMYQSYVIVREGDDAKSLADLRGGTHAFFRSELELGFSCHRFGSGAERRKRPRTSFAARSLPTGIATWCGRWRMGWRDRAAWMAMSGNRWRPWNRNWQAAPGS